MRHVTVTHQVHDNFHDCRLPGWWARRSNRLGKGSVVECKTCHRQYILSSHEGRPEWNRHR